MRVLLITPFYAPDLGPSAALFSMLCEDLVGLGHQVSVIAAVPHYPTGRVVPEFRGRVVWREKRSGVDVTRVWVPSVDRARLGMRAMSFACYQLLATAVGLARRYDILLVTNPALESGLPFLVLGVLGGKPIIFSVHDIYPEVGVKLSVFRSSLTIRCIRWAEDFCLRRASRVRVLSDGFRATLQARGIPDAQIAVIWDWLDTDSIHPLPRVNSFSSRWGLNDSFVVMYAGNLGISQGLDIVVEAARLLVGETPIRIVLVGDGADKERLRQLAHSSGLSNIHFIPFQPRELLSEVLASADVSLIALKRGVGADSVPSKCYSILGSGRPVVAAVDPGSDTWNIVRQADGGLCIEPEDPRALADAILSLYGDKEARERFARNGRTYVVARHSRMAAARQFDQLLAPLVPGGAVTVEPVA